MSLRTDKRCIAKRPRERVERAALERLGGQLEPFGRKQRRTMSDDVSHERRGASMVLRLALPGAAKDDVDLAQHDDELLVRVGPYRRAIVLPDSLRRRPVSSAKLVDGALEIRFGPREKTTAGVA